MKKLLLFGALAFGLNAFGQVPNYVPTDNLVGWWPFEGNANDLSSNGNNGTLTGGTSTTGHLGGNNSAYLFNGIDEFITISDNASLQFANNQMSISFWLSITSLPNPVDNEAIFYKMDQHLATDNTGNSAQGFRINFTPNGDINFRIKSGASTPWVSVLIPGDSIVLNTYNHIVFINDGTTLSSYLNANFINSTAITNNTVIGSNNADLLMAKSEWISLGQPMDYLNGALDDVGLWDRPLTECEIIELYTGQACNVNLEELLQSEKELVKIIDFMGRETEFKPNTPLIFIYSDGTRERVMKLEE